MFHKTESERELEELLKDADRIGSEIWRQISGGPNLQCIAAGHFRGPTFFELLDFDYDCNTIIEEIGINALYLWGFFIGFLLGLFILCCCCCRDSKPTVIIKKVYKPVFPESQEH